MMEDATFREATPPDFEIAELRHRMKNNLQSVASLLRIQSRQVNDSGAAEALRTAASRISAIQRIDSFLEKQDALIDIKLLLETLVRQIRISMTGLRPIAVDVDVEPGCISPKLANAVGLITNELATNALKHAFPNGRTGIVRIQSSWIEQGLLLEIQDDGVGIDELTPGLGMSLLRALIHKLGGDITLHKTAGHGAHWQIFLPVTRKQTGVFE